MATRREILVVMGAGALVWPGVARAQAKPPVVIGWLDTGTRESDVYLLIAFKEGLASHGWKEGTQYVIEERWLGGRIDQLARSAQELAARKPHVIVAQPSSLVVAAAKAAPNTPIVQTGGSPLESGIVASLARPGGMITGVSAMAVSLTEKLVELLHEAVPKARRVGFLIDPKIIAYAPTVDAARRATKQYSIDAGFGDVTTPEELEPVISRLARDGAQAIIVLPNLWFTGARHRIVKLALTHRLPLVAGSRSYTEAGALLSYGADAIALRRRAAYFVDRILRGANPGDLPLEQPTKFELFVNIRTAKALGLTISQPFLMRADRVIE